jgi:hypothetical protein
VARNQKPEGSLLGKDDRLDKEKVMTLLIRHGEEPWAEPEITGFKGEGDLQEILAASPNLLPGSETGLPMATVRELHLPPGHIDVLGVDAEGEITLCECKLSTNPGARREVVGQLLEYAGALEGMQYEDFSARFEACAKKPLTEAVSAIVGDGFDAESFEAQATDNLAAGRFRLVFVVDRISEALKQTVSYLNEHLDSSVLALELAYLSDKDVEMLVPVVYGAEIVEHKAKAHHPPVADADTVIVAAHHAYQEYLETEAYVCQPGRSFRDDVRYLGFYKGKAIQREIALILHRRDNVVFRVDETERLRSSGDENDAAIAKLIENDVRGDRHSGEERMVFLLSPPNDRKTLVLQREVRHEQKGAWTQAQRYTSSAALQCGAATTEELEAEGG